MGSFSRKSWNPSPINGHKSKTSVTAVRVFNMSLRMRKTLQMIIPKTRTMYALSSVQKECRRLNGKNSVLSENFWRSKCSIEDTHKILMCAYWSICTAVTCKETLLYAYLRRHIKQCKLIDRYPSVALGGLYN